MVVDQSDYSISTISLLATPSHISPAHILFGNFFSIFNSLYSYHMHGICFIINLLGSVSLEEEILAAIEEVLERYNG